MKDDIDMLQDHMWIMYGEKGSTVSIDPLINMGKIKEHKQLLGLLYHQYALQKEAAIHDLTKEELEQHVSDYLLFNAAI